MAQSAAGADRRLEYVFMAISVSRSFLYSGLVLLVFACVGYLNSAGPSLEVKETDIEVGPYMPGQEAEVALEFLNKSNRPIKVFGVTVC